MKGGKREGAGRKKGSMNKATRAIKAKVAQMIAAGEEMPLDYLLREMRVPEPVQRKGEGSLAFVARYQAWDRRTLAACIAAAPFCHNRLTAIEHNGKDGGDIKHVHSMEVVFVKPK